MRVQLILLVAAGCLQAAGPLGIVNAVAHQMEDGSPTAVPKSFTPGEVVFFSFQVENYKPSPENKVRLSATVDAYDPKGVLLQESVAAKVEAEMTPQDKEWKPKVRAEILIPPLALPGAYRIVAKVKDEVADAVAEREFPLTVAGRTVAESPSLVVRNFGFYRTEEEQKPLATAAYRPGDTVWVRFDITGYRFGPRNKIDVEYGVAVISPGGKVLFSQPQAATEQGDSFYPRRYLPNSFNLNVQPNTKPGPFTIVLTVKDNIGRQTHETKQVFSVE
jgi:hypothetical protein